MFHRDPFLTRALMPEVADQLPRTLLQFLPWERCSIWVDVKIRPAAGVREEIPAGCEATVPRVED